MKAFAECGADIFLAGHLHVSQTGQAAKNYRISGYSALVVQAGTATSTRSRGEANSFNVIRIEPAKIGVECVFYLAKRAVEVCELIDRGFLQEDRGMGAVLKIMEEVRLDRVVQP